MKIQDIIDAGVEVGARYLLVEQDHVSGKTAFQSIARSIANLRKMRGLTAR
jgi:hypothetical protein